MMEKCRIRFPWSVASPLDLARVVLVLTQIFCGKTVIPVFGAPFVRSFYFPDFNTSSNNLTYLQDAFFDSGRVYLTSKQIFAPTENLTVPLPHGIGRVLYGQPIQGRHPDSLEPTSFSTTFIFSILNPQQLELGDGLAFIITANASMVGSGGAFLGVMDQSLMGPGRPSAHTFAVEFDTWQNPELFDPDGNHVGVDMNSLISRRTSTAGFYRYDGKFRPLPLSGLQLQAWIDYSSATRRLEVSISPVLGTKPSRALLSFPVDLSEVMQDTMFVGFVAATGDLSSEHIIHSWSFNVTGRATDFNFPHPPQGSDRQRLVLWLCIGAASLVSVAILLIAWTFFRAQWPGTMFSKVHIGDPEAVVLPADRIRDAARAQANLNISKILAETHMRASAEEEEFRLRQQLARQQPGIISSHNP